MQPCMIMKKTNKNEENKFKKKNRKMCCSKIYRLYLMYLLPKLKYHQQYDVLFYSVVRTAKI